MSRLSIAVITRNEEANLRACLASAAWADEIVVIDAESSDATAAIAREFTERVYIRAWPGFAAQKAYSLEQCTSPWIFSLDADERIRPELAAEIRRIIADPAALPGYRVGRRSWFLGRWIRHGGWYPGYQLRLFRRDAVAVIDRRVHEGFSVAGEIGTLQGDLDHFSHPSIVSSLEKMGRYSTLEALDRLERQRVRALDFFTHPLAAFLRKYIAQGGFRDGRHGLVLAWVTALVKLALYMKIWHLQRLPAVKEAGAAALPADDPLEALFSAQQRQLELFDPATAVGPGPGQTPGSLLNPSPDLPAGSALSQPPGVRAFVIRPLAAFCRIYRDQSPGSAGVPVLMQALLAAAYATAREIKIWEAGVNAKGGS